MTRIKVFSFLAAMFVAMGASAFAQSMEEKRDKKLAEAWVKSAPWITDYDKARKESLKTGRPIFAYFTRSYAG